MTPYVCAAAYDHWVLGLRVTLYMYDSAYTVKKSTPQDYIQHIIF
jgi:hypothetical protein